MTRPTHLTLASFALLGLSSMSYGQSLVNIDFQDGGDPTASGTAVLGSNGDQWNGFDASAGGTFGPASLFDNLGNSYRPL